MFRLCGYAPQTVAPTRALLLAHTHLDDRVRATEALTRLAVGREPACCRLRIVAADGITHDVVGAVGHHPTGPGHPGAAEIRGWVIAQGDGPDVPAPSPSIGPSIPGPRGRDGYVTATRVSEPAVDPRSPAPRPRPGAAPPGPTDAVHAETVLRAEQVLAGGLGLDRTAAATLVAWLANTHEVPPVIVAEEILAVDAAAAGRPDLAALLAVLDHV